MIQSYRTGRLELAKVPLPALKSGQVMVQATFSAVSLGTEGQKVSTARQSMLGKARARPDLVRQVIDSARQDGLLSTCRRVMARLDEPIPLGYSSAGQVIAIGPGVEEFRVGDRVACGGASAAHAEVIAVPVNLCVRVPDGVDLQQAAFTTIGAIALQGVRQAGVTLGECVAVVGLGIVGQLAIQMLKANGCRVFGIDLEEEKVKVAKGLGADQALVRGDPNLEAAISSFSRGYGVDAVLITAATSSNDPAELAVEICRDRGRIVVVGAVRLDMPRDACYEKELEFKLSRSYGPGRYDPVYESKGVDYPIGYVRWTEKRNMEAFLDLLAAGQLDLDGLITHRFAFEDAEQAYGMLTESARDGPVPLGIVFEYDTTKDHLSSPVQRVCTSARQQTKSRIEGDALGVGFIGAGSFARKFLIPPLSKSRDVQLIGVSTATGISGQNTAKRFGFTYSAGDYHEILKDPDIRAIFVATRHNLHATLAAEALQGGKCVFVEKPLALTREQLDAVVDAYEGAASADSPGPILMVGFNRRFAPLTQELKGFLTGRVEPMVIHYRVNAGFIKDAHWVHDLEEGGGRVLGEACHFIDLVTFLVGAPIRSVYAVGMDNAGRYHNDNACITLSFADGSVGSVLYVANGDRMLPKERVEVFYQGDSAVLDDFRRLELYINQRQKVKKGRQDKGHQAEVQAFVEAVHSGGISPIPFGEIVQSTLATFAAVDSTKARCPVELDGGSS